jgi:hypothetical protein
LGEIEQFHWINMLMVILINIWEFNFILGLHGKFLLDKS